MSADDNEVALIDSSPRVERNRVTLNHRGRGKTWLPLVGFKSRDEFMKNLPDRSEYVLGNKRTTNRGFMRHYACRMKGCKYCLRTIEEEMIIEYSGSHNHLDTDTEMQRRRGLSKEQKKLIDQCLSRQIRGTKGILSQFMLHNRERQSSGLKEIPLPGNRQIYNYLDYTRTKFPETTADENSTQVDHSDPGIVDCSLETAFVDS